MSSPIALSSGVAFICLSMMVHYRLMSFWNVGLLFSSFFSILLGITTNLGLLHVSMVFSSSLISFSEKLWLFAVKLENRGEI